MISAIETLILPTRLLADVEDSFWFPKQASSFAAEVDWVYDLILYMCLIFFIPMMAAMVYFMFRYSKKKGEKAESQVSHHTALELTWSIGPSILLVWMFIQGSISFLDMRTPPQGSYDIGVQAFKWGWAMDYGGGTIHPELHVAKGEPTNLSMRSTDVIHSLFIPAFRVKKDIVPGRYNYLWFNPTVASKKVLTGAELEKKKKQNEGVAWDYDEHQITPDGYEFFDLYCTEYCGTNHSEMQTVVVVHETKEELDAWVKANSKRPDDLSMGDWGELLYRRRGCAGCHTIDGNKLVGPSFKDLFSSTHPLSTGDQVTVDENYVRESIIEPKKKIVAGYQPVMPSYKGQLSDDDIASIIEFLKANSSQGEKAATTAVEAKPEAAATTE